MLSSLQGLAPWGPPAALRGSTRYPYFTDEELRAGMRLPRVTQLAGCKPRVSHPPCQCVRQFQKGVQASGTSHGTVMVGRWWALTTGCGPGA